MTKRVSEMTPAEVRKARAKARARYHRDIAASREKARNDKRRHYQDQERREAMKKASREWKRRNRARHLAYNREYYHKKISPLKQAKYLPVVRLFKNWITAEAA